MFIEVNVSETRSGLELFCYGGQKNFNSQDCDSATLLFIMSVTCIFYLRILGFLTEFRLSVGVLLLESIHFQTGGDKTFAVAVFFTGLKLMKNRNVNRSLPEMFNSTQSLKKD